MMANEIDGLMGIDEWSGFVDPWDKAEEPDDPFDETCLDCAVCTELVGSEARYALKPGRRVGGCHGEECFVTDEDTVRGKQLDCFER